MADTLSGVVPVLLLVGLVAVLIRVRRASRAWADRAQLFNRVYTARVSRTSPEEILREIALRRGERLGPVTRRLSLGAYHGVGLQLYGHSAEDIESGSYVGTQWLTFVWLPIIPLARYRLVPADSDTVQPIGQLPLRTREWLLAISGWVALIAFLVNYWHG